MHGQKCLCESCGIQHHIPRGSGGVSSTHALGNKASRPQSQLWTLQQPMNQLWSLLAMVQEPLENCLRESPMDDRAFVKVQVFSREVPAHH